MIRKLVTLKNVGKFKNLQFGGANWNGIFEESNIIYAQNGSGKTTLSLLFQSLTGDDELLQKKKTFDSTEDISVKLIGDDNKEIKYVNQKWNKFLPRIKVFNSHFIDNNVYIINLNSIDSYSSSVELVIGEEQIKIIRRLKDIDQEIKRLRNLRKRKRKLFKVEIEPDKKKKLAQDIKENLSSLDLIIQERNVLKGSEVKLSEDFINGYLDKVNFYLKVFNPDLELTKFRQINQKMLYGIKVSNFDIRTDKENIFSLKYSLSEGDKNALAFSFFMADVELSQYLSESIVVIDDPVTSFDYGRKNSTINIIRNLRNKVKKLIILTHDFHFANELTRRLNGNCLNLKIIFNGISSSIVYHDIESESLTGIFKDLKILHDFNEKGAHTDSELREIVRCIRPAIEGILRIKYYGLVNSKEWLGDIIGKIKASNESSPFYRSKPILDELSEINDYSKEYHHSNPYYLETPINANELKIYVIRVIELLRKI